MGISCLNFWYEIDESSIPNISSSRFFESSLLLHLGLENDETTNDVRFHRLT